MPFIRDTNRVNNIPQSNILNLTDGFTLEECEAIERYCTNYHKAYLEAKEKGLSVITEITVE